MKTKLAAIALGTATIFGAATAQAAEEQNIVVAAATQSGETAQTSQSAGPSYNLFDPSTWTDGAGHVKPGEMVDFDPASPKGWAMILDPKTHSKVHMTLTNPQYYAKFMTPAYYVKYMDPRTWLSYMDLSTYDDLFKVVSDPQTAAYWLQPGAYMHTINPTGYVQMMDPNAYAKMAVDVAVGYGVDDTNSVANMLNPFTWMKQVADATATITTYQ